MAGFDWVPRVKILGLHWLVEFRVILGVRWVGPSAASRKSMCWAQPPMQSRLDEHLERRTVRVYYCTQLKILAGSSRDRSVRSQRQRVRYYHSYRYYEFDQHHAE